MTVNKRQIMDLAEAASRASELITATNMFTGGLQRAHHSANHAADVLQFELGKLAGLVTDDGFTSPLGESLWAGTASREECMTAAQKALENQT